MNERPPFHMPHQKGLDGLRGLSILMVLLCHVRTFDWGFGFIGVNTFFVLSGFLITTLLVAEWDQSRTISLRDFYLRRALRLLPALVAVIVVFTIYMLASFPLAKIINELRGALWALLYVINWAHIYDWGSSNDYFVHTWSLSIEEQFYLVWPLVLLCLLKKQSRQSILCWIFFGIFLCAGLRFLILYGSNIVNTNWDRLAYATDARADCLLTGCFIGVCFASGLLPQTKWFRIFLRIMAPVSLFGIVKLGLVLPTKPWMMEYGWLLASIFAALLILYLMCAAGPFSWLFRNPVLVYIGQISYGLYLWHVPIMTVMKQHGWPWQGLVGLVYLWPAYIVTLASYYFIEKPFLRLKHRFERVK